MYPYLYADDNGFLEIHPKTNSHGVPEHETKESREISEDGKPYENCGHCIHNAAIVYSSRCTLSPGIFDATIKTAIELPPTQMAGMPELYFMKAIMYSLPRPLNAVDTAGYEIFLASFHAMQISRIFSHRIRH